MLEKLQFYIDGQWVDPVEPRTMDVVNPATEEVYGQISLGSAGDVDEAVGAAKRAFETFSQTSVQERIDLLQRIYDVFVRRADEVAEAIMDEMGAPWGWPMNQIAVKVAPAIAAGCTMVLKPSEIAPFDAILFAEILDEAGVPAGVFNLINGDGPGVGTALSQHPDISMVSFTGSTRAGVLVAQNAAPSVKRVAQELGGKSANIILDDADLEVAVADGTKSMFENTGQSCDAPSRMLVPKDQMDAAAAIAAKVAAATAVGNPREKGTRVGPVVSELQWNKIQDLIQKGIDEGATLVAGGTGKPDGLETGYYVKPTVFADVTNDMTIAREEIFGPVLSILAYDDEDEAIRIANDTPYGLSGYVSSGDLHRARRVASRMRTGMVHINGADLEALAPFGGYKQSGNGREWGAHGMDEFLEVKSVYGYEK